MKVVLKASDPHQGYGKVMLLEMLSRYLVLADPARNYNIGTVVSLSLHYPLISLSLSIPILAL